LHAAGQTQGAENTVFSFAYPGKKAMSREIFPGKFYAAAKNGGDCAQSAVLRARREFPMRGDPGENRFVSNEESLKPCRQD
jgi:hypothetical protein